MNGHVPPRVVGSLVPVLCTVHYYYGSLWERNPSRLGPMGRIFKSASPCGYVGMYTLGTYQLGQGRPSVLAPGRGQKRLDKKRIKHENNEEYCTENPVNGRWGMVCAPPINCGNHRHPAKSPIIPYSRGGGNGGRESQDEAREN